MIFAHPGVETGVPFGTALTRNNIAGENSLTAEFLDAETTARCVAPVTG